ncbi:hypothetical protein Bhyg_08296, partial [Pseudolycoriella hygida]
AKGHATKKATILTKADITRFIDEAPDALWSQAFSPHLVPDEAMNLYYLFHTWSIYMTLVVALWRLFGILRPIQSRYWQSYKNAISLAAIFLGFATLLVPMCFVGSSIQLYNPSGQQIYDSRTNSSSTELLPQEDEEYFEVDYDYDPDYVVTQTPFGESLQFWIHGKLVENF